MGYLDGEVIEVKKDGFGYLPNMSDIQSSIRDILEFYIEEKTTLSFAEYIKGKYGNKSDNTVRLIQNTLSNYGLIHEVDDYVYCTTDIGRKWLEKCSMWELVRIIHEHIKFIGEILYELREKSLNGEELSIHAEVYYNLDVHGADLTRRIQLLRGAGMVRMNRRKVYILTQEGAEFLRTISIDVRREHVNDDRCADSAEVIEDRSSFICKTNTKIKEFNNIEDKMKMLPLDRDKNRRQSYLIKQIMECLSLRRTNELTQGWLEIKDIYMCLYSDPELKSNLTENEISDILNYLSTPLVGAVKCKKNKDNNCYYAEKKFQDVKDQMKFFLHEWDK